MFKPLFTVTGLFAVVLGVLLLASPETYLSLYALDYTPAMNFPAQRFAPVILGVGALLLLARDVPPGPFAARFSMLVGATWFLVAATGVYHFATGSFATSLLVAAGLELLLGVAFMIAAQRHKS